MEVWQIHATVQSWHCVLQTASRGLSTIADEFLVETRCGRYRKKLHGRPRSRSWSFFVIQMLTPDLFEFGNLLVYLLRTVVRVAKMTSFASKIQYLE